MAVYKIFPTKDATLYSEYPDMNTGLDPILEASTYIKLGTPYTSRYLIQFSTHEIQDIINNKISSTFKTYLKNYAANVTGLNSDSKLIIHPVSGSWEMGTGNFADSPQVTNGVSWKWKDYVDSTEWENEGGDFYENTIYSQSFSYSSPVDLNIDVTPTILDWYSGSIPNDGFIVKQPTDKELVLDFNLQSIFKYFSIDTHTIYPPYLEFKWDDSTFNTGSSPNTILSIPETFISVYNNRGIYYPESIERLRIAAVPKYTPRTFITSSYYTTNFYLPESQSFYAIKDSFTNEFVIDFDSQYTRISADEVSSFFDLNMNGLEPERYYTILIKTTIGGTTRVFDEDIRFKIIKGN